jgi:murein DD-endopeptidase MepM/ murein hydrolase activator NlpD
MDNTILNRQILRRRLKPVPILKRAKGFSSTSLSLQGAKLRRSFTRISSKPTPFAFSLKPSPVIAVDGPSFHPRAPEVFRKAFRDAVASVRGRKRSRAFLLLSLAGIACAALLFFYLISGFPLPRGGLALPSDNYMPAALLDFLDTGGESNSENDEAVVLKALPPEFSTREYVVLKGDSIGSISKRFSLNPGTIISVNGISDTRNLSRGTRIKLPNMNGLAYTVRRGDTIGGIARTYGIGINVVLDANNLDSEILSVGKTLFVPGAKMRDMDLKKAMGELFIYPTYGQLSSPFGIRPDPFTGIRRFHNGIDLASPTGTRVAAALDGRVADIGYNIVYGNYVILLHSGGYQSWYAHLSQVNVRLNQSIGQGQKLGEVGNTGYSTGSHLHFSIFRNGNPVNPLKYLH